MRKPVESLRILARMTEAQRQNRRRESEVAAQAKRALAEEFLRAGFKGLAEIHARKWAVSA